MSRRVLDLATGEMVRATACAALMEALRSEGRIAEGNRVGQALLEDGGSAFAKTIAYYELACNYAEMDERADETGEAHLEQALEHARRALDLAPDELVQFPLAALGWIHYKRQEYEQAVDYLSRSIELGPSAATLTHLGMALLASGRRTAPATCWPTPAPSPAGATIRAPR